MPFLRGEIVDAKIPDPDGNSCVDWHPTMVIGANRQQAMLVIVGITGSFDRLLKPYWTDVPWAPGGHPETGLDKECVLKGNWVYSWPMAQVRPTGKFMPQEYIDRAVDCILLAQELKKRGEQL